MAKVKKVNIKLPQGTDYTHEIYYVDSAGDPVDLTGYTARCQFRATAESSTPFYEATSNNGKISVGGVDGKIVLTVPNADSTNFNILQGLYDIEIVSTGALVTRIMQGQVTVDREITR